LNDSKNCRVLQVVKQLNSNFRWCLSGTPPHQNFNDVSCLADLMGIHLGVEEQLPGVKLSMPLGGARNYAGVENMSRYMEIRSLQWHERRHELAQAFLDRFVRQNVAEIDEIPYEEHVRCLSLPPAERAVSTANIATTCVFTRNYLTLLGNRRSIWSLTLISRP
jgi:SNF2-related domain